MTQSKNSSRYTSFFENRQHVNKEKWNYLQNFGRYLNVIKIDELGKLSIKVVEYELLTLNKRL